MKTYREVMIHNNGMAGDAPGLAKLLTTEALAGWEFETLVPVPGTYLCALLSKQAEPIKAKPKVVYERPGNSRKNSAISYSPDF